MGNMKLNLGNDYLSSFVFKEVSNTRELIVTRFGTDHKLKVQHSVTVQLPFVLSLWKQRLLMQILLPTSRNIKHCAPQRGRGGL